MSVMRLCDSKSIHHGWALPALVLLALPLRAQERPKLDVPYVPTPQPVVEAMLKLAAVKPNDTVYDLGCGDGRIVITAVKQFQAKRGVGIDLDPVRVKESVENAKKAGVADKVEFKQGDVLKLESVADANVVRRAVRGVDVVFHQAAHRAVLRQRARSRGRRQSRRRR